MRVIINKTRYKVLVSSLLSAGLILGLQGCGGSGGGSTETPPPVDPPENTVSVSGVVSAPGGAVAFNQSRLERMLAGLLVKSASAAIEGVAPIGAGVTINLIEVDASGAQVDAVIASAVTDAGGAFSIDAPEGFVPGPQFVIRAVGSTTNLDARVTSLTPDVDPLTSTSSSIIADKSLDLSALTLEEMGEISAAVEGIAQNVDATALSTAELTAALNTEATASEEVSNIVTSTAAAGQICGNVSDSNGAVLENIRIVVRDFGEWVTRAKTKTDASGNYCLNVPVTGDADPNIAGATLRGEYILGAMNFTGSSMAASQWWTSSSSNANGSGGTNSQNSAEMINISSNITVTRDFILDANGSRITGTVTGGMANIPMEGMRVVIRNYDTFKPLTSALVKADGTYRVNVKAVDYMLAFRNRTRHPYASEIYRAGTNGAVNRNMASRETMIANTVHTYDANLDPGVVISGQVSDAGTPVSGTVIRVNNADSGRIESLRTNRNGNFRIWVNPRIGVDFNPNTADDFPYILTTYGQIRSVNTNGADENTPTSFKLSEGNGIMIADPVTTVTGRLVAADGVTPVPLAVMRLSRVTTDTGDTNGTVTSVNETRGYAVSNADGSFTFRTNTAGVYVMSARMDDDLNYGSGQYDGTNVVAASYSNGAGLISVADLNTPVDLGSTIRMPTLNSGASVGYLEGNIGAGSNTVMIRLNGVSGALRLNEMVRTLARGDGSYKVTLPTGTYDRIRSRGGNCDSVVINDGVTTTLNFNGTATPPCVQ